MRWMVSGVLGIVSCMIPAAGLAAKPTPAQKCEVAKLKAAGKKAACRTAEMAKAASGDTADR